jgi:cobalamin biosynthesis protein CobT
MLRTTGKQRELPVQRPDAREILQALVQGYDPLTGDELPSGSVLQQAEVMRALLAGISALNAGAARAQRRAQLPENVGRAWSKAEEDNLTDAFHEGASLAELAVRHGRTPTAIEARLEKLGLVAPEERVTVNRFIASRGAAQRPKSGRGRGETTEGADDESDVGESDLEDIDLEDELADLDDEAEDEDDAEGEDDASDAEETDDAPDAGEEADESDDDESDESNASRGRRGAK